MARNQGNDNGQLGSAIEHVVAAGLRIGGISSKRGMGHSKKGKGKSMRGPGHRLRGDNDDEDEDDGESSDDSESDSASDTDDSDSDSDDNPDDAQPAAKKTPSKIPDSPAANSKLPRRGAQSPSLSPQRGPAAAVN